MDPQKIWDIWSPSVKPLYEGFPSSHDFSHIERVFRLAARIGFHEGADLSILLPAVLLHDLGRPEEEESEGEICHAQVSAEKAAVILSSMSMENSVIEAITHCIDTHRYRGEKVPLSLEAKCLYDADKLDSLGAVGIARSYLWLGEHGGPLYSDPEQWRLFDPGLNRPEHDSLQREWAIKYRYIKDKLFTKTAKRIAEKRHNYMYHFLLVLEKEVKGEL